MPSTKFQYTDPTTGARKTREETLTLEVSRDASTDLAIATIRCTRSSSSNGDNDCIVDASDAVNLAIYGNGMLAPPGQYMTVLTASEVGTSPANTTLSVENSGAPTDALPRGLNATAGDPVAIIDYFDRQTGEPHTVYYRLISSVPGATSIVINDDLDGTMNKGAFVWNLRYGTIRKFGTGRGINKKDGARSYIEAPDFTQPSVAWQASPAGFLVTFPTPVDAEARTIYRVYIRSSEDDKLGIEPHFVADLEVEDPTTAQLVTTYDGGTAAGGGSLSPASTYQIHFTRAVYTSGVSSPQSLKTTSTSRLAQIAV